MTVLVTGGAGYIGSHMVLALTDAGEDVVVLDNLSTGIWWAIAPKAQARRRRYRRRGAARPAHGRTHASMPSSILPARSWCRIRSRDPLGYYLNNTVKSRTLMACAVKAGIPRFIFSSTAAVYGNPPTEPVFEDAAPAPDLALWHARS